MTQRRTTQHPDHLGLLYLKERSRRRLSSLIEGQARDVIGSNTVRRRISLTLDGSPKVCRYYFELSGHLLKWWEEFGPGRDERGSVSLLSCQVVRDLDREERSNLPSGTKGGFCITDAATDSITRRGDIFLYSDNVQDVADWLTALRNAFSRYHISPLAGLGPTQAASEKPILEGELLCRDNLEGLAQPNWTKLLISLFDNRIECRPPINLAPSSNSIVPPIKSRRASLNATNNNQEVPVMLTSRTFPTCRVDRLTPQFYVGDSRVAPHAFLVSDFLITHYFAAKNDQEKLFWMQTIAKMLRNMIAMHDHAIRVKETLSAASKEKKRNGEEDTDDDEEDDDDDEDDEHAEEELDRRRPSQVRRESFRRFYGEKRAPDDELSTPPKVRSANNTQENVSGDDFDEGGNNNNNTSQIKLPSPEKVLATPPEKRKSLGSMNLALSLSQLGASGTLNPRLLTPNEEKKKVPEKNTSQVLTIFQQDAVSLNFVQTEFTHMIEIAKKADPKAKSKTYKITFAELVKGWGTSNPDDIGGILLRAKRAGIAKYEGDMLFSDYDDNVVIQVTDKKV